MAASSPPTWSACEVVGTSSPTCISDPTRWIKIGSRRLGFVARGWSRPPNECFFFFFRQRTEGSALSRDEHEAPRMRSLIDATHPGAVGRAPPPERLSPIHPLGHGGKKEKEKKTTFPRKVQLGKSRGNPQDRKTTRCLILLRAGGWRVLNRSCDHVLRKTRFSTLQTLVTGGGQIVRLWSASLGGSKGRPIDKSNRPAREGE